MVFATDELDEKLLMLLRENARLSFRQLATKTGMSASTVINRVKALEKNNVVKKYSVQLNYDALGYDLMALINLVIHGKPLLEVQQKIASLPNVVSVYDVTGDYDSVVLVRTKNRRELSALVKKILAIPGVERTNTNLVLNTVKENYAAME